MFIYKILKLFIIITVISFLYNWYTDNRCSDVKQCAVKIFDASSKEIKTAIKSLNYDLNVEKTIR